MDQLAVGDVVVVSFPFSNLKGQKFRPALIAANAEFDDLILCQITSNPYSSQIAIELSSNDFAQGNLPITSYIRPDKLFTADRSIIARKTGTISPHKKSDALNAIRKLFS